VELHWLNDYDDRESVPCLIPVLLLCLGFQQTGSLRRSASSANGRDGNSPCIRSEDHEVAVSLRQV